MRKEREYMDGIYGYKTRNVNRVVTTFRNFAALVEMRLEGGGWSKYLCLIFVRDGRAYTVAGPNYENMLRFILNRWDITKRQRKRFRRLQWAYREMTSRIRRCEFCGRNFDNVTHLNRHEGMCPEGARKPTA